MNEGDIFATLFHTCDESQIGRVRVSKIIQYLQQTTQSADTSSMNLQHLQSLLDPEGNDTEIDYDTYIQRISTWVRSLRQERTSPERHNEDGLTSSRYIPEPVEDEFDGHASIVSTDSIEGYGGDLSSRTLDQSELMATVSELQTQIQKLSREKEELLRQLDVAEEANSQLTTAVEEHKRQLKTSQSELGRVKQTLSDVQLSRESDNQKASQLNERNEILEQTRLSLETSITDSKEQLFQRAQELEHLEETNRALTEQLETLQNRLSMDGEGGSFSLDRSLGSTEELLRLIDELKSDKEAAVKDRDEVEQSLLQARQENERLRSALDVQQPVCVMAPASPVSASTPFKPISLQHEIIENTDDRVDSLPGSIDSQKENDNSLDLTDASLSSSLDHFSLVASQAHAQFRQKHELALKQITELTALDPARYTREESVRTELEEDETSFKNKLSHLITSKQNAEKKLKKLHSLVSRYKAEKQELVRERNDAVDRLEGYVRDTEARSKEIADLKGRLAGEQFKNQNLQRELNDTKRESEQLKDENQSLNVSAEEWSQHRGSLEQHIRQLQSCLQDKEVRQGSADDHVVSLRDENEMLRKTLACEKSRITELENALLVVGNRHNKELHDVWQILVDSRRDEVAPQQDMMSHNQEVTGYQVKELLIQQLQTLRSEMSQQEHLILDMSAVSHETDQTPLMPDGKDLQTSLQESVGCQTELSWEHEPIMPGISELGCSESSEDVDTDVDTWGAPKSSSSPVAKDAPSTLAREFEFVLSQILSEKATLRQRIDQQAKAYESTETNFSREVEEIRQAVQDFQPSAITREEREMCSKLTRQCDVLKSVVSRLARKAAAHSALKQEERLASRFDVVFRYVKCLQGEVAKVSDELWSGQNVMAGRSAKMSESSPPDHVQDSINGGQDLVEAKLRLERLTMDVQKCEKDITELDKRVDAVAALPRIEVKPVTCSQRSLWSRFQSVIALLVLIGLLLFLAIELTEHAASNDGRSFFPTHFLTYHQGTPPS